MAKLIEVASGAAWWSSLEITARYGTQFAVMLVLARLLSPADFGLLAILLVFTSLGALLVDSGFGTALIQRHNITDDDETTVFLSACITGIVAALALVAAAPVIAHFFSQPGLLQATRVIALVLPLGALASVPDALLTKKMDFRARAGAELIASLCSGSLAILLAVRGFGVWSLICQAIASILTRTIMLWLSCRWWPRGRFSVVSFRRLFGFGSFMLLSNLLNTFATRLQTVLIGRLFSASELGLYSLAQSTQSVPASLMSNLLNRVGLPIFSSFGGAACKLREGLRISLRMAMFVFVPCMAGIALVSRPLIALLFGARWLEASPILALLALSAALWPLHVLNLAAIGAQGRSKLLLRVELVKQTFAIALIAACSPWGPTAVAAAVLASSIASVGINTHYSRVLLDYGAKDQLLDQAGTFALTAAAMLAGGIVLHVMPETPASAVIALVAGAAVYLSSAFLFRVQAMTDLLRSLHSLRSPPDATDP